MQFLHPPTTEEFNFEMNGLHTHSDYFPPKNMRFFFLVFLLCADTTSIHCRILRISTTIAMDESYRE